jgi:hypothetical protein
MPQDRESGERVRVHVEQRTGPWIRVFHRPCTAEARAVCSNTAPRLPRTVPIGPSCRFLCQ